MKDSVNKYIIRVWKDYHEFAGERERKFDLYIPLFVTLIIVTISSIFINSAAEILSVLKDFNNASLNVISILAGFNTASLSVIAASNFTILGRLFGSERVKKESSNGETSNLLKQTVSFFGYAILLQLFLLIIGAILVVLFGSVGVIIKDNPWPYWNQSIKWTLVFFSIFWLTIIFHSLFISIRNITVLYSYVLLIGHESNKENNEQGDNQRY